MVQKTVEPFVQEEQQVQVVETLALAKLLVQEVEQQVQVVETLALAKLLVQEVEQQVLPQYLLVVFVAVNYWIQGWPQWPQSAPMSMVGSQPVIQMAQQVLLVLCYTAQGQTLALSDRLFGKDGCHNRTCFEHHW